MSDKKKRCEVNFYSIVGVRKIVYADTPEEAFAKALKKTVEGRNNYIGSGFIFQSDITCKSKDLSICSNAKVRYEKLGECDSTYKFEFDDDSHIGRIIIGDFSDAIAELEKVSSINIKQR